MNEDLLARVVVVLKEPQDLVNVAGVIRAMKNMGLSRLRLVRPAEFDPWRIEGIAHRTEEIVESALVVDSLEEAVADCTFVVGTTARPRTAHRNYVRPRQVAPKVLEHASSGQAALLFGREDRGLENRDLDLCHAVAIIPTNPSYPSINLAQAALLLFYEVFLVAGGDRIPLPEGRRHTRPATAGELENTYRALEAGLHRIDFFKVRTPESVMRTLRTMISRAEPDLQEAGLLRAIGFEIGHYLDRLARRSQGDPPASDTPEGSHDGTPGDDRPPPSEG